MLSKVVSSTILKVFGMTQHGIEPRSPGPLANTLPTRPMQSEIRIIFKILTQFAVSIFYDDVHSTTIAFINFYNMCRNLFTLAVVNFSLVWLGVIWHINHCRLFNAKASLYIYIKYIGFGFVGFYSISTIVVYLMPNPLYTYIINI